MIENSSDNILNNLKKFILKYRHHVITSLITGIFIAGVVKPSIYELGSSIGLELFFGTVSALATFGLLAIMDLRIEKEDFLKKIKEKMDRNDKCAKIFMYYLNKRYDEIEKALTNGNDEKKNPNIIKSHSIDKQSDIDPFEEQIEQIDEKLHEDVISLIKDEIKERTAHSKLFKRYLVLRLKHASDIYNSVLGKKGARLRERHASVFYDFLFKNGHPPYMGLELKIPSQCTTKFGEYIKYHEKFEKEHESSELRGKRILVISKDKFKLDCEMNRISVKTFMDIHDKGKVALLQIDPEKFTRACKEWHFEKAEIGIWNDSFILLFIDVDKSNEARERNVRIIFPDSEEFNNYKSFYEELLKLSDESEINKLLKLSDESEINKQRDPVIWFYNKIKQENKEEDRSKIKEFAEILPQFVNNNEKRKKGMDGFLKEIFEQNEIDDKILDAAGGMGYEVIWLLNKGFRNVIYNERYDEFYEKGLHQLHLEESKKINETHWGLLDEEFNEFEFNLILLLGNAFSHELSPSRRKLSIESLFKILQKGGRLVVDRRNYEKIIKKWRLKK